MFEYSIYNIFKGLKENLIYYNYNHDLLRQVF
jgi:hypothetical protein